MVFVICITLLWIRIARVAYCKLLFPRDLNWSCIHHFDGCIHSFIHQFIHSFTWFYCEIRICSAPGQCNYCRWREDGCMWCPCYLRDTGRLQNKFTLKGSRSLCVLKPQFSYFGTDLIWNREISVRLVSVLYWKTGITCAHARAFVYVCTYI